MIKDGATLTKVWLWSLTPFCEIHGVSFSHEEKMSLWPKTSSYKAFKFFWTLELSQYHKT